MIEKKLLLHTPFHICCASSLFLILKVRLDLDLSLAIASFSLKKYSLPTKRNHNVKGLRLKYNINGFKSIPLHHKNKENVNECSHI